MTKKDLDIYFNEDYGRLYEKIEGGILKSFKLECNFGKIKNIFIRRKIPIVINGKIYNDIITPYGYGGPIILDCDEHSKENLINQYEKEFFKFCMDNNIVSEFIRFHPIEKNALDFKRIYNIEKNRITLGTNLKDFEDPIGSEFCKNCRRKIKKALKDGVTFEVEKSPENLDEFIEIYYLTMDRNNALEYYYFDKEYFNNILKRFRDNIVIVKAIFKDKVIASEFCFLSNKTIHIHLSGSLTDYLSLSPTYVLRYAVTLWGKENGYELVFYGGGRTSSLEDGLYKFKKNFSKNTFYDFYIGKKIWNEGIYRKLCESKNVSEVEKFFPAYRKNEL
ncbi:GNAT family N-acetyltransferase [Eubacterium multiforme]|uniref:BioF2-like acetyltransferase domain-containing protein n=1 Tax=Eubacterium multiforme TaxID=83339 RepID=A0ABT9UX28_9FIRM|nr:GNAT family N-acetyltransferase [Eubacterium multiforme]MDQ0150870.1 hypothetical protein [Eubacterium multiforme]